MASAVDAMPGLGNGLANLGDVVGALCANRDRIARYLNDSGNSQHLAVFDQICNASSVSLDAACDDLAHFMNVAEDAIAAAMVSMCYGYAEDALASLAESYCGITCGDAATVGEGLKGNWFEIASNAVAAALTSDGVISAIIDVAISLAQDILCCVATWGLSKGLSALATVMDIGSRVMGPLRAQLTEYCEFRAAGGSGFGMEGRGSDEGNVSTSPSGSGPVLLVAAHSAAGPGSFVRPGIVDAAVKEQGTAQPAVKVLAPGAPPPEPPPRKRNLLPLVVAAGVVGGGSYMILKRKR
jgi:hypothetical protein